MQPSVKYCVDSLFKNTSFFEEGMKGSQYKYYDVSMYSSP